MASDSDCVFCKIVAGEVPAEIVYQDRSVVAFLDITPLAEGHLLVIPPDHYSQITEMPPDTCGRLWAALPRLGRALLAVTGAEAFNVLQNNGRLAGQVVPHVHLHLIPRNPNDELGFRWNAGKYPPGRDAEVAAAYREILA